MSQRPHRRSLAVAVGAAVIAVAGCSEETRDSIEDDVRSAASDVAAEIDEIGEDALELAARNVAARQGEEALASAGYELDGDLSCTADIDDGLTEVTIECSGTTTDGAAVELAGSTSEIPGASLTELEGSFTATVGGEIVFETERLGG